MHVEDSFLSCMSAGKDLGHRTAPGELNGSEESEVHYEQTSTPFFIPSSLQMNDSLW